MSVGGVTELLVEDESGADEIEPFAGQIAARSPLQLFLRRFRQDRVALVSLAMIGLLILAAIFAPLIVKLVGAPGPNLQNTGALSTFGTPTGPDRKSTRLNSSH